MRENEFEKRVQEKMGDFGLRPSDEVWAEVEKRIRKEKKRRFIFWWPLLFLLLGAGIAAVTWFNYEKQQNISGISNKETKIEIERPAQQENGNSQKMTVPENTKKIENNVTIQGNSNKTKTKNKVLADIKKNGNIITTSPANPKRGKNNIAQTANQHKNITEAVGKKLQPVYPPQAKNTIGGEIKKEDEQQKVLMKERAKNEEVTKKTGPVSELTNVEKETIKQATDSANNQTEKKQSHRKTEKWNWGFEAAAGKSGISNGFFSFNKALYADALSQQATTGSGTGTAPSRIYPSFSWSAGLYGKKSISKRLDMNVGLGYTYFSTKLNTGSRIDSARNINNTYSGSVRVENFYRVSGTGSSSAYTNKYHFISLSGNISWQVIRGKKIRLYWENGLLYNRLLGSSMLHYDDNLPGYYKDNKLLTRNHILFTTGFSIPVSQKVWINPYAAYSLTPVLKNTNSSKANFTDLSLRVKFFFNKKN